MPVRFFHATAGALALLLSLPAAADSLTAEQARRDADILVSALRTLHPALDKYRSDAQVDAAFAQFRQRAGQARTSSAMYLAATELAASIRCGHTWTNVLNQQGAIKQRLLETADKLPLTMTLVEGRWRVLASATPAIAAGEEVVTIDGHASAAVVAAMLPYLRADGASDGKRLRQLDHDRGDLSMMDTVWPLLAPPREGRYQLTVRGGDGAVRSVTADATTLAARAQSLQAQGVAPPSQAWRLRIDGDVAVMTLPTFALYRDTFDWRAFFADSFGTLRAQHVARLVIDIRANEGGDGAIGLELLSYLVNTPVTYVSDQSVTMVERVPYQLARYLDTWDFGFFDRTGQVDRIVDGPQAGRWRFRPNANRAHTITPRAARFTGATWLLVGPENSSATFALAQLAQQTGAAKLVGQNTGGNQRGLNGGQLAWVNLPHSGVAVDIPLLASSYRADTPDASVTPDLPVRRSYALQAAGRDQELEAALAAGRP
ncbi:S41 family peptidase [Massilia sp. DWR3-1-1]|uniref:S41 family peptidase n=1 Tax=Massilia sp. DWR3-1-1 TaxID=2804559 RepID=UPI003CFABF64